MARAKKERLLAARGWIAARVETEGGAEITTLLEVDPDLMLTLGDGDALPTVGLGLRANEFLFVIVEVDSIQILRVLPDGSPAGVGRLR